MNKIKSHRAASEAYFDSATAGANLKNRAMKGTGAMIFTSWSSFVIQFFSQIILARLLCPEDFGLIAMALTVHSIFQVVRNIGLMDATVQRENITHELISTMFWINVIFGILLSLTFIALSPLVAWFYKEPRLKLIMLFLSVDYLFGALCTQHRALLRRNMQMYRWAAIDIISLVVSFGAAIILSWQGFGYWALVSRWVIFTPIQAMLSWALCPWRPGLPSKNEEGVVSMLRFGFTLVAGFFIDFVIYNVDKIIIGRQLGSIILGHYNRAYSLYETPAGQLSAPISGVAISALSRTRIEPERFIRYYSKIFSTLALIGFPIGFVLALTGKDIIQLFLGPQWGMAGELFAILGFGIGFQILYDTHSWVHISLANNGRKVRWGIFSLLFSLILYSIGLSFGAYGIAAARSVSLYLLIIPAIWYAGHPIGLRIGSLIKQIWKYYLASLISALLCWYLGYQHNTASTIYGGLNILLRLITMTSVYIMLYSMLVVILHRSFEPMQKLYEVISDMRPGR